jgi:hypothetical protein
MEIIELMRKNSFALDFRLPGYPSLTALGSTQEGSGDVQDMPGFCIAIATYHSRASISQNLAIMNDQELAVEAETFLYNERTRKVLHAHTGNQ